MRYLAPLKSGCVRNSADSFSSVICPKEFLISNEVIDVETLPKSVTAI